jgi:hypothetical protein
MKSKLLLAAGLMGLLFLPLLPSHGEPLLKIGPAISFGKCKDLSGDDLLNGELPGFDLAVRCAERLEAWGAYRFSKTTERMGHGYDRYFRLDAFAAGLHYLLARGKPIVAFVGAGLNYYHFADDSFTPFIFPVTAAFGPCLCGGFHARSGKLLQLRVLFKYNLMKHTERRTTAHGTYHYRIDFSGLESSLGLLFSVPWR